MFVLLWYLMPKVHLRYKGKSFNLWNIFSDSDHGQETDAHGNHPDCNYDESNLERKQKKCKQIRKQMRKQLRKLVDWRRSFYNRLMHK